MHIYKPITTHPQFPRHRESPEPPELRRHHRDRHLLDALDVGHNEPRGGVHRDTNVVRGAVGQGHGCLAAYGAPLGARGNGASVGGKIIQIGSVLSEFESFFEEWSKKKKKKKKVVIIKGVKGCEMINESDFVRVWELKKWYRWIRDDMTHRMVVKSIHMDAYWQRSNRFSVDEGV
jgi:hypothetical protein